MAPTPPPARHRKSRRLPTCSKCCMASVRGRKNGGISVEEQKLVRVQEGVAQVGKGGSQGRFTFLVGSRIGMQAVRGNQVAGLRAQEFHRLRSLVGRGRTTECN